MVKTMGDSVKPHLQKIWAETKKTVEDFEAEAVKQPAKKPEKVTPSPAETPKKADSKKTPKVKEPKKQAGQVESQSVVARRMKENLALHGESLNLGYTPISIEEETNTAIQFVKDNPKEAKRIAYASESGDNLKSNAIRLAYAESIFESGDMEEAAKIANRVVAKNTELGQAVVINRGFTGSPIEYVKQVIASRIDQVGKKMGKGTKKSASKKVSERIKSEVGQAKEKTKAVNMNIANAQAFIESLRC